MLNNVIFEFVFCTWSSMEQWSWSLSSKQTHRMLPPENRFPATCPLSCFLVPRFPPDLPLTVSAQWPMPPLIFCHPEACLAFSSWPLPSNSYSSAASRALCTVIISEQNMVAAMCIRWSGGWWDQEAWQPVGHVLSWSKVRVPAVTQHVTLCQRNMTLFRKIWQVKRHTTEERSMFHILVPWRESFFTFWTRSPASSFYTGPSKLCT